MGALSIYGGNRLSGEVRISGAKNSALPILAACLLVGGVHQLENCPDITDIRVACGILEALGCRVCREGSILTVDSRCLVQRSVPEDLVGRMRASILFQGAAYARFGSGILSQPGGCPLGARPIDLHLAALQALGAKLVEEQSCLRLEKQGPDGGFVKLRYPSVGATENALLAAAAAGNDSILTGCACEPEIVDLANFLNACGAKITGAGTQTIFVRGGRVLSGAVHRVIPDRMETVSYLCACLSAGGRITLRETDPGCCRTELELLEAAGCKICAEGSSLSMDAPDRPDAVPLVVTGPYPRFPTDAQPLFLAALCRAHGVSRFCETVFESRFGFASELEKLGARLQVRERYARLEGVPALHGASLCAQDLRGAAALLIAAVGAEGETKLSGLAHLARGYSDFPAKLRNLGANLRWEHENEYKGGAAWLPNVLSENAATMEASPRS